MKHYWIFNLILNFYLPSGVIGKGSSKIMSGMFENGIRKQDAVVSFGSVQELQDLSDQVYSKYEYASKEERIYAMYEAFYGYHSDCTDEAASYLDEGGYNYHSMWSSNTMVIRNADPDCVKKLADMDDVKTVAPVQFFTLIDPIENQDDVASQLEDHVSTFFTHLHSAHELLDTDNTPFSPMILNISWGLDKIYVPEAWEYGAEAYYYGAKGARMDGEGIVVANIDTGVMGEHECLRDNHREYAGWADGYNISSKPVDVNGHGTHTMSTICGSHGVGVAPGAEWIACRGCLERGCHTDALLFCCNWIICPHDLNEPGPHDYKHCSTAPDLVSNSWGGGQGDHTFERCAIALRTAGIIPIWAHGNSGPECNTANSPGDLPMVIGVGATDKDDKLADFSSRGPAAGNKLKPDCSAPGVQITGAWPTGTNKYVSISGTSMATPHVAGLVALMLQRCKLGYDEILNILQTTADREGLATSNQICGGTTPDEFPNNFYGWGRVNALDAVRKVVQVCQYKSYGPGPGSGGYQSGSPNYGSGSGGGYYEGGSGGPGYSSSSPPYGSPGYPLVPPSYPNSSPAISTGYNKKPYQGTTTYSSSNYGQAAPSPSYAGRSGGDKSESESKPKYQYQSPSNSSSSSSSSYSSPSYKKGTRINYNYNRNNNKNRYNYGYGYNYNRNNYNYPRIPYSHNGYFMYRG